MKSKLNWVLALILFAVLLYALWPTKNPALLKISEAPRNSPPIAPADPTPEPAPKLPEGAPLVDPSAEPQSQQPAPPPANSHPVSTEVAPSDPRQPENFVPPSASEARRSLRSSPPDSPALTSAGQTQGKLPDLPDPKTTLGNTSASSSAPPPFTSAASTQNAAIPPIPTPPRAPAK